MTLKLLYQVLFGVTWAVHYAFIMLLVGTPLLALVQKLRGQEGPNGPWQFFRSQYPFLLSMTITTGIAPLLFSQVLFHRAFYQTFINLHPWPLLLLALLTVLFYAAYLLPHARTAAVPLTVLIALIPLTVILFWSTLYASIGHAGELAAAYWAQRPPTVYWQMWPVHVATALVGAGLFFGLAGKLNYLWRGLLLVVLAVPEAVHREIVRQRWLGEQMPAFLPTHLDPAFFVFLVCFVVMGAALVYSVRLAFRQQA